MKRRLFPVSPFRRLTVPRVERRPKVVIDSVSCPGEEGAVKARMYAGERWLISQRYSREKRGEGEALLSSSQGRDSRFAREEDIRVPFTVRTPVPSRFNHRLVGHGVMDNVRGSDCGTTTWRLRDWEERSF